jgi:hypothetical protein
MIDEAEEVLVAYPKLHPDAIAFFAKTDWNKITLKYCPYNLFPGANTALASIDKALGFCLPFGRQNIDFGLVSSRPFAKAGGFFVRYKY